VSGGLRTRASDRDREAVAELLRRHHLAGRLSLEEFEERLAAAHRAVTLGDLAALHEDLPDPPARRRRPARGSRVPGRLGFSDRIEIDASPARAHVLALETILPAMARSGYELEERSDRRLAFVHRRRPGWTIAVAILLFPFGLLALAVRDTERIVIEFDAREGGGTAVLVHGVAPLPVRRAFAELSD
jgi:hypothetical protein